MNETRHWPSEIRLARDRRSLTVTFTDGGRFTLAAEYLRVLSPSAEVQGHDPSQRRILGGKADVEIAKVEPVGRYAVRLTFSDRHDTGIYSWDYLWRLGAEHDALWAGYLADLAAKGLSR